MIRPILLLAAIILQIISTNTFTIPTSSTTTIISTQNRFTLQPLYMANDDSESSSSSTTSLEEKMKSWEASEEEIKAATLGGVVPGSSIGGSESANRRDGFDVGLWIAFPIMVISCLAFVFFPILIGNIDVSSVGPPPTS